MKVLLVSNIYPTIERPHDGAFIKNIVDQIVDGGGNISVSTLHRESSSKVFSYARFYISTLLKGLFAEDGTVIYVHYLSHSIFPALLVSLIRRNVKLLSHVHGSDVVQEKGVGEAYFKLKSFISRLGMKASASVICPSAYFKNEVLVSEYGIPESKIFVSPSGGVNLELFKYSALGVGTGRSVTLGFVGRLTKDKGIEDFVLMVSALREQNVHVSAVVVGDGPMRSFVEELEKDGALEFLGPKAQEELPDIYSGLDLFVFPTTRRSESLGLVGIEAMACGTPVIAYDMGGPSSYVSDRRNGFLVEKGCASQMVECVMDYIALSREARALMSAEARRTAELYSSTIVQQQLLQHIKSLTL